jgi:hypothetical protein
MALLAESTLAREREREREGEQFCNKILNFELYQADLVNSQLPFVALIFFNSFLPSHVCGNIR